MTDGRPLWTRPRVLVLGAGAAGLTAALSLRSRLGATADVVCVTRSDRFVLAPALVRLPFDSRTVDDVSFPVAPVLRRRGVDLLHEPVTVIDVRSRLVRTDDATSQGRTLAWDRLVIATGRRPDVSGVPGAAENAALVTDLASALRARRAWARLADGADVVVANDPDTDCLCPAAEVALVAAQRLRGGRGRGRVRLVTGRTWRPRDDSLLPLLEVSGVDVVTSEVVEVAPGAVRTLDGRALTSGITVVVPRTVGNAAVARARDLADAAGLVPVLPTFRTVADDAVYAIGAAAAVRLPWRSTSAPPGEAPRSPAQETGLVGARHLAHELRGGDAPVGGAAQVAGPCLLDGGDVGVLSVVHDGTACRVVDQGRPLAEGARTAHAGTDLRRARACSVRGPTSGRRRD